MRFDPGLVLSSAGFGELSSYVIVFLWMVSVDVTGRRDVGDYLVLGW